MTKKIQKEGSPAILAVLGLVVATGNPATADTLFVSDFSAGSITRFNLPSTVPVPIVNGLLSPEDGDCSPGGLIYFAESNFNQITRWNQDGSGALNICPTAGTINGPEGLVFDPAGNLFINTRNSGFTSEGGWRLDGGDPTKAVVQIVPNFSDWGEGSTIVLAGPHTGAWLLVGRAEATVYISEPPGAPLSVFIPSTAFPGPPADIQLYGIATNGCGEVFLSVTDFNSFNGSAIYRFDADGNFLDIYLGNLQSANFLDFDSAGNLYVADGTAGTIWQVRPDRSFLPFSNAFVQPNGIAVCRTQQVPNCATAITCNAGGPYHSECTGPVTCVTVDGSGSSGTGLSYAWSSDCPGGVFANPTAAVTQLCLQSTSCATSCIATLAVTQGSTTKSCSAEVHVEDTLAPLLAGVPADETVECDAVPPPAPVTASDLCDPDVPVTFAETRKDGTCPGDYTLTRSWSASDDCGHPVAAAQTVTVVDTTPPEVLPGTDALACLWPPNHWYVCFDASQIRVQAKDNCSEPITWKIAGCGSDQPDDAREDDPSSPWNGDGHTSDDCVVLADGAGFCVRAERAGTGPGAQDGRHYGVSVVAVDACGNESLPVVVGTIHVPHDQSPHHKDCLDTTKVGCRPNQSIPCVTK